MKNLCLLDGETEGGRRSCPWIALRNGLNYGRDLLSTRRSPTVGCGFKNLCVGYGVDGRMTSLGSQEMDPARSFLLSRKAWRSVVSSFPTLGEVIF